MNTFEEYVQESAASDLADQIKSFSHDDEKSAKETAKALGVKGGGSFKYNGPLKKAVGKWLPGKDYAAFAKFLNSLK